MTVRSYNVTGMHCASCGLLVDDTLEDVPGVTASETDVRAGTTRITATDDVSDEAVLTAIASLGYRASRVG